MMLVCLAGEIVSALLGNASITVIFGVSYLVCYAQMQRWHDEW